MSSDSTPFRAPNIVERAFNRTFGFLVGLGLGPRYSYLLEVRGRKSGRIFSTPINLLELNGKSFLVAPRGQTQWVKNAEAAGEVTLKRGRTRLKFRLTPVPHAQKPEILKTYLDQFAFAVQKFFPIPAGSPVDAFRNITANYPVFELVPSEYSPRMRKPSNVAGISMLVVLLVACSISSPGQGGVAPIVIKTTTLPKAYLRQPYRFEMQAEGGITPRKWQVINGALPSGIVLGIDGVLSGVPTQTGVFSFSVKVTDSDIPPHQITKDFTLLVVTPLIVRWSQVPKINGHRVDGSIKVSDQTGDEFDLTMIVLAVNENGRATAIGYQHFPLKKNTLDFEIPFGENLPQGSYSVNVDVVAEVAATNNIFRGRLVTNIKVVQGP